jgi:hypothetical protein
LFPRCFPRRNIEERAGFCYTESKARFPYERKETLFEIGGLRITEAARIFLSLPFRTEGQEEEHPGCLKQFDSRHIDRFLEALDKEIGEASQECDDLLVREIVIGNGSVSHLTADDLTQIVHRIRMAFPVSPQAEIRLTVTPSGFDFYKLNAIRQLGNSRICMEFPALSDEVLQAAGYHCSAEKAEKALDCCFQNGFRNYSVFLTADALETEVLEGTLNRCLEAHPKEIILRKDAEDALLQAADRLLSAKGWTAAENRWYREAIPEPVPCSAQIGLGPGAITVFDSTPFQSARDFDFYCSHSDDFEALVRQAETEHA